MSRGRYAVAKPGGLDRDAWLPSGRSHVDRNQSRNQNEKDDLSNHGGRESQRKSLRYVRLGGRLPLAQPKRMGRHCRQVCNLKVVG